MSNTFSDTLVNTFPKILQPSEKIHDFKKELGYAPKVVKVVGGGPLVTLSQMPKCFKKDSGWDKSNRECAFTLAKQRYSGPIPIGYYVEGGWEMEKPKCFKEQNIKFSPNDFQIFYGQSTKDKFKAMLPKLPQTDWLADQKELGNDLVGKEGSDTRHTVS